MSIAKLTEYEPLDNSVYIVKSSTQEVSEERILAFFNDYVSGLIIYPKATASSIESNSYPQLSDYIGNLTSFQAPSYQASLLDKLGYTAEIDTTNQNFSKLPENVYIISGNQLISAKSLTSNPIYQREANVETKSFLTKKQEAIKLYSEIEGQNYQLGTIIDSIRLTPNTCDYDEDMAFTPSSINNSLIFDYIPSAKFEFILEGLGGLNPMSSLSFPGVIQKSPEDAEVQAEDIKEIYSNKISISGVLNYFPNLLDVFNYLDAITINFKNRTFTISGNIAS